MASFGWDNLVVLIVGFAVFWWRAESSRRQLVRTLQHFARAADAQAATYATLERRLASLERIVAAWDKAQRR